MSLLGGNRVPVNMLRVTAAYDSYILSYILPFSWDSWGSNFEPVLYINCGLVQGEVAMRIWSVVPVRGIFGNGLTGSFPKLFIASAVTRAMSYEESGRREEENDVVHAPDALLSIEWCFNLFYTW